MLQLHFFQTELPICGKSGATCFTHNLDIYSDDLQVFYSFKWISRRVYWNLTQINFTKPFTESTWCLWLCDSVTLSLCHSAQQTPNYLSSQPWDCTKIWFDSGGLFGPFIFTVVKLKKRPTMTTVGWIQLRKKYVRNSGFVIRDPLGGAGHISICQLG